MSTTEVRATVPARFRIAIESLCDRLTLDAGAYQAAPSRPITAALDDLAFLKSHAAALADLSSDPSFDAALAALDDSSGALTTAIERRRAAATVSPPAIAAAAPPNAHSHDVVPPSLASPVPPLSRAPRDPAVPPPDRRPMPDRTAVPDRSLPLAPTGFVLIDLNAL